MVSIDRRLALLESNAPGNPALELARKVELYAEIGEAHDLANEENWRRFLDEMEVLRASHGLGNDERTRRIFQAMSKRYLIDPREINEVWSMSDLRDDPTAEERLRGSWPERILKAVFGTGKPDAPHVLCRDCVAYFADHAAFEKHRSGSHCVELAALTGIGLVMDANGFWG